MPRGGPRKGTPGKTYGNRTDLNKPAPKVNFDGGYGSDVQQAPLQANRTAPAPVPRGPAPGSLTPLDAPTMRPDEPITAGLPMGPGPGPEVLGVAPLSPVDKLKRIYRLTQNPDILQLILLAEDA